MAKSKTYELMVKIAGKTDSSLKNACLAADKNLAALGKTAKSAGKVVAGAAVAAATAVGTVGVAAVKAAAEYETQLANVSTLLTGTEAEIAARTAQIGGEILDVSNRTGVATANLTDGMYQVISAFGDSADAAKILETAAKSAAAGNATTTDSVNLLSAVTKGYGDISAEAVQKAADLSFATVRLGQTSFPELAASMGQVIPLASTLGVEQEQLFGAMATLTGVTGSTAEVVTQLRATMQGFLSPSKSMQVSLRSMGYESGQALLESKGLQGALDALKESVGGNELAFAGLFSSVKAQTAVLSMAGSQSENLTAKTAEMYQAAGAADTAFQRQTNTMQYTIQIIKNLGANFLTQLGTNILPYVRELAEAALPKVQSALQTVGAYVVNTIIPAAKETVAWVAEHSDGLLALGGAIGTAVIAYKAAKAALAIYNTVTSVGKVLAMASTAATAAQTGATVAQTAATAGAIAPTTALAAATNALCWPMLAVVAAIAAVVSIVILLVRNWDTLKEKATEIIEKLRGILSAWSPLIAATGSFIAVAKGVPVILTGAKASFTALNTAIAFTKSGQLAFTLATIRVKAALLASAVATKAQAVASTLATSATTALGVAVRFLISPLGIASLVIAGLVAASILLYKNWDTVKAKAGELGTKIGAIWANIDGAVTAAISAISERFPLLGAVLSRIWTSIQDCWANIHAVFSNIISFIDNVFSGNWSAAWQNIVNIFGNVFGLIVNLAKVPINAVISAINWVLSKINSISVTIPDWVPGVGGKTLGFNIPTIPALAAGGVATAPTLAMIGEGGEPEAVLPLSKLAALLDEWSKKPKPGGGTQGGGDTPIQFSPVFNFYGPTTKEEAVEAGRVSFAEFKRLYERMKAEERRKQFSPA